MVNTMYLQGNLQQIFDALYHMGVIDPVLEMDWGNALDQMDDYADEFFQVLDVVNASQEDMEILISNLKKFDQQTLSYLAMEVAREYADYHSRETLH
jgi:hypothetical protein